MDASGFPSSLIASPTRMPPSYSPLSASTDPQSTSDSDPLPPAKERPLRPPPFEIPDPFAPFTRSRPSNDSTDSSLDSDIASEDDDDRDDRGLSEKIGSTLDGDDPEDASSWRERKHAQSKVRMTTFRRRTELTPSRLAPPVHPRRHHHHSSLPALLGIPHLERCLSLDWPTHVQRSRAAETDEGAPRERHVLPRQRRAQLARRR